VCGEPSTLDSSIGPAKASCVQPDISYADSDGVFIAYQTVGTSGLGLDLLVIMEGFIPIDTMDDEPRLARAMRRLGSFARVIRFDRRGIGLSDPMSPSAPPTLEQWVDDAIAVLDAADAKSVVVLASAEASPVGLLCAATHPDRVKALVTVNGFARVLVDDDYPIGFPREVIEEILDGTNPAVSDSETYDVSRWAPSAANDPHFREWWQETGRRGASPTTARALMRVALECDVRPVLPALRVPVLVACLQGCPEAGGSAYLAEHVPGATLVEIAGDDDYWWAADAAPAVLDEIEEFATGARSGQATDRHLATLLFTDIVASTEHTSAMGDERWRELLDRHDVATRRQLARYRGTEVNTTGDGFLSTFDGPARAVECAHAIREAARQLGLEVRSGVHTGEVERRGRDVAGIAVHIAARVAALAEPGTVWVSRTVVDLVVGSQLDFSDRGAHQLKGVPGTWQLYSADG
jgi:class 3 adenylate cyclase